MGYGGYMKTYLHMGTKFTGLLLQIILYKLIILSLITLAVLWALIIKPLDLERIIPLLEERVSTSTTAIRFENIAISYRSGFKLNAGRISIQAPQLPTFVMEESKLALANKALLRGVFAPKDIFVDKLTAYYHLDNTLTNAETVSSTPNADIVHILNALEKTPRLAYLRTITASNVNITMEDAYTEKNWYLQDAALQLNADNTEQRVQIKGILKQDNVAYTTPVQLLARHVVGAPEVSLEARFTDADTGFIAPYIPTHLQNYLQTKGRFVLGGALGVGNEISAPWFAIELNNTVLNFKEAYTYPLEFSYIFFKGSYNKLDDVVFIDSLILKDENNLAMTVHGTVAGVSASPTVDIQLKTGKASLAQITHYLPNIYMDDTTAWLNERVKQGIVTHASATWKGAVADMPYCAADCGLDITADVSNVELKFLDNYPAVTFANGTFMMGQNSLTVVTKDAKMGQQVGENVMVSIDGIFEDLPKRPLIIHTDISGGIPEILDILETDIPELTMLGERRGNHASTFSLRVPLYDDGREPAPEEYQITINSNLTNVVAQDIEGLEGVIITSPKAQLTIADNTYQLTTNANINGAVAKLNWQEDVNTFGEHTRITLDGLFSKQLLYNHIASNTLILDDNVPIKAIITSIKPEVYDYDITSNLTRNKVKIPPLDYSKAKNEALNFSARGRFDNTKTKPSIYAEMLQLVGDKIEILGDIYVAGDDFGDVVANLNPLKANKTNTSLNLLKGDITVKGKSIDISKLDIFAKPQPTQINNFTVDVDKAWLENGYIQGLRGEAHVKNKFLHTFSFNGLTSNNKPFAVSANASDEQDEIRTLQISAQDAGELLRVFGLFEKMQGGTVEGNMTLDSHMNGKGLLWINNVRLLDAPIVVKLLSLTSLQQILATKEGIRFDKVIVPFEIKKNVLYINEATFSGPSIGLTLEGAINLVEQNMMLKGQLVPVSGINSFINSIPLVGDILTGSQKGVLVADFALKGDAADPDVQVNPLSVVTPGLVKDFFRTLTGN